MVLNLFFYKIDLMLLKSANYEYIAENVLRFFHFYDPKFSSPNKIHKFIICTHSLKTFYEFWWHFVKELVIG